MNTIIVAWNNPSAHPSDLHFERKVPLVFNGERNRRLGSTLPIHILFLEGLDLLSTGYREHLVALGYVLHNMEACYHRHEAQHPTLLRFSDYERKCFLRWLVIEDFIGKTSFAHFDADIVFNATPEEIGEAFAGLTFILQGCPAFTMVSDPGWLAGYRTHLTEFSNSIDQYSAAAWRKRPMFAETFRDRNNYLWDRELISSDQDLLEFLTLDNRLPQANAAILNERNPFALFQNPLTIDRDLWQSLPVTYRRDSSGIDIIAGQKVAFWHMQGDFCNYLGYATFRLFCGMKGRAEFSPSRRKIDYKIFRVLSRRFKAFHRLALCERYFESASEGLAPLLNGEQWHQADVFV